MSTEPQPWTQPVRDDAGERVVAPGRVAGRDDVEVAVEAEPRAGPAPGSVTRAPTSSVRGGLLARVALRTAQCAEVVLVDRRREPARLGERREPLDRAALAAR